MHFACLLLFSSYHFLLRLPCMIGENDAVVCSMFLDQGRV